MVWVAIPAVWLPFQPGEPLCAFTALADIELHDSLAPDASRRSVPLFSTDSGLPFSSSQLASILRRLLYRCLPPDTARLYSWHSARIFLATMLLQSGASRAVIQALCRWQTDESINIYARLDASRYASYLNAAMRAKVTTGRAQNLGNVIPLIDVRYIPRCPPPLSPDEGLDTLDDGQTADSTPASPLQPRPRNSTRTLLPSRPLSSPRPSLSRRGSRRARPSSSRTKTAAPPCRVTQATASVSWLDCHFPADLTQHVTCCA